MTRWTDIALFSIDRLRMLATEAITPVDILFKAQFRTLDIYQEYV